MIDRAAYRQWFAENRVDRLIEQQGLGLTKKPPLALEQFYGLLELSWATACRYTALEEQIEYLGKRLTSLEEAP